MKEWIESIRMRSRDKKWAGKEIQLFPPVLFMKPYQSDSECARTGVRPDAHSERELK